MSKSKNTLEVLFDSRAKVKILKFLFRNIDSSFSAKELAKKVQERPASVNKEIGKFLSIGLLKISK